MRSVLPLIAALMLSGMYAAPASPFTLEPIVTVIDLPADSSGETIVVRNPRDFPLAVTFEIVERSIHDDGTETQTPADDAFLVFPPQAVVPAGATQAIRVQWLGTPLTASRSFTIYGVEAPIDLSGQGSSGIRTILKVGASVHVTQAGLSSTPVLTSSNKVDGGIEVQIANEGNRFVYIDELALTFGDQTFSGRDLGNIAVRTLITPGATRTFMVPDVDGTPTLRIVR